MANNRIQVKRTSTTGRTANVTNSGNSQYINAGELALNMADGILYSSNGSALIEVGSNNTTQRLTNALIMNNDKRINFNTVNTSVSAYFVQQNDDNFVFYTTNTAYGQRPVWSIFANSITSAFDIAVPLKINSSLTANGTTGTAGQFLTSNGTATYWSSAGGGAGTVTSVGSGNGLTGGPVTTTGTLSVLANTGIVANATGVFVNATYIGTLTSNNATNAFGKTEGALNVNSATTALTANNSTNFGGQLPAYYTNATNITTGTLPYAQIPANIINTTAAFTRTGITTFSANVVLGSSGLSANGSFGTATHVLHSNGTATYWAADDNSGGTVTSVATGNGMTGGTISTTGTVSVLANTGIVANATGTFVNASYIATIASNSATYANASISNTFTVGTASYFVANGNLGVGTASPEYKLHVTGNFGFFNNGIRLGAGYSAIDVATGVSGLFLSGSQGALNHQFISPTGNVGIGNTAPNAKLQVTGNANVSGNVVIGGNLYFPLGYIDASTLTLQTSAAFSPQIVASSTANDAFGSYFLTRKARITGAVQNGDDLGTFIFQGHDGTTAINASYIVSEVSGTVSTNIVPSRLGFYTTNATGIIDERFSIENNSIQFKFPATAQQNLTINGVISNGSLGTAGQFLTSNGTATYWSTVSGGSGTVTSVGSGNGLTGGPITGSGSLSVLANTGIVANATGLFVNATYIGSISANNSSYLGGQLPAYYTNATNITTGTLPYAQIPANVINTTAAFTRTGITTFSANVVLGSSGLSANGSFGTATHVLHSNGTATYWAADDNSGGTVTSVATGNGMTGGTITATGTVSVLANTGIVANATGVFVNAAYIATISANNASFLGTVAAASYVQNTDSRVLSGNLNFTGTNNFFSTGLFVGANVIANTTALFVGNSTANSTTNATAVTAHIQHASRKTLGFNYTVANTVNSLIVGPYAVNTGFTLTVESGARLVIV